MNKPFAKRIRRRSAASPNAATIYPIGELLRRRRRVPALSAALLFLACAGVVYARFSREAGALKPTSPLAYASASAQPASGPPERRVSASVILSEATPFRIEVSSVKAPEGGASEAWGQHELHLINDGDDAIFLEDYRSSVMLPSKRNPRLIVGDDGCGYVLRGDDVEAGACSPVLDHVMIGPDESVSRGVGLWVGLPGMRPLRPGRYRHERQFSFTVGTLRQEIEVTIEYRVR